MPKRKARVVLRYDAAHDLHTGESYRTLLIKGKTGSERRFLGEVSLPGHMIDEGREYEIIILEKDDGKEEFNGQVD